MLKVLAAMFGYASPAWPNRVPPRLAVQGDNDDDKPWRAFTASHKLKGRGRNGKGTDRVTFLMCVYVYECMHIDNY